MVAGRKTNPDHINMLETMAIRFALIEALKYIRHSCVMITTDNTTVVSYIIKQGETHSPDLCVQVWKILLWCLKRHIPGKFNVLADRLSRIDKVVKTEWALDQSIANSIFQMFSYPNLDLFATRFNHKLPLYVSPVLDNQAFATDAFSMNLNYLHAYAFPPTILIPSVLNKIRQSQCRIVLITPLWPQQAWFSEVLQLLVSAPVRLPLVPNLLSQGKLQHQNLPALNLHAWELPNNYLEIKHFSKNVADFVSRSRRTSTQKVYDAKWIVYTRWCHRRKVNPISAPLTVIADFLIYLFSEKKYQISTYRSMISNTPKFKTGNRIGSNPVLSELIRSFELQRPVQRSLTSKWDLSWVLICLQKPPYEPLHKASKLHVTLKTAFPLALATAKRCSEIHALAMDSKHLRFNQSDGSVSLMVQPGFLAKNQLPSICPDPIVIPNLARVSNRKHSDGHLCPSRALKFYLKMTKPYRQNRTRLFLPIKGKQDISKPSVSRWISYTIQLAYRKLTRKDFPF